jgi:hypothetical protein
MCRNSHTERGFSWRCALGGPTSAGDGGLSSVASQRLSGILSGVAVFMIALSAWLAPSQGTKRHVFQMALARA